MLKILHYKIFVAYWEMILALCLNYFSILILKKNLRGSVGVVTKPIIPTEVGGITWAPRSLRLVWVPIVRCHLKKQERKNSKTFSKNAYTRLHSNFPECLQLLFLVGRIVGNMLSFFVISFWIFFFLVTFSTF